MRLTKYRIKRYASDCKKQYVIQEKGWILWKTISKWIAAHPLAGYSEPIVYDTYEEALKELVELQLKDLRCKEAREWAKSND